MPLYDRYFEDQRLLVESAPDILQLEPQAQAWMLNDYDSIAAHSEEDGNSIGKATDGGGSGFYDDINDHISSDARRNRNNNGEDSVGSSSSSAHGDDDTRMKKTARAHPGHRSRTSTTKCMLSGLYAFFSWVDKTLGPALRAQLSFLSDPSVMVMIAKNGSVSFFFPLQVPSSACEYRVAINS